MEQLKSDILDILESNAHIAPAEIAAMVDADEATVCSLIRQMEDDGVIIKYTVLANRQKLSEDDFAEALIEVKITPQRDYGYDDLAGRIYKYDEVQAVYLMAGAYDLAVRIKSRSMKDISKFVFEKLAVIDGVTSTITLFIMRKYKEDGVVLVGEDADERLVVSP